MKRMTSDEFIIPRPEITFEQLCDWAGGLHAQVFPIPRKFAKNFGTVFQVWGDSPPKDLRFEIAVDYDGETRYVWVSFK